jgi:hypothetical protein
MERSLNLERKTICLLGPKRCGKSSLLRTLRQCLLQDAHGYEPDYITSFTLKEITRDEFRGGRQDPDDTILTRFVQGDYSDQETVFFERENGTEESDLPGDGPRQHYFSLEWTAGQGGDAAASGICLLQIVDAAGELSTPRGPTPEDWERHRVELENALRVAHGVILVVPPADGRSERWATYMIEALERLLKRPSPDLRNLAVVFSQYDRLFSRCGRHAVGIAVRPHAALYAIRREFASRVWLRSLTRLMRRAHNTELRFTVASALGFTKVFGNANVDPNAEHVSPLADVATGHVAQTVASPEQQFRFRVNGTDAMQLWWPFLSADPFIFAATGMAGYYMFTPEDVQAEIAPGHENGSDALQIEWTQSPDGGNAPWEYDPEPPPDHSPIQPERRPWLRRLRNYFNANAPSRS